MLIKQANTSENLATKLSSKISNQLLSNDIDDLRLIYEDFELPFENVLQENKQESIHQKIMASMAIEIFK